MPFPFPLPTTSKLSIPAVASSTTHPSLPLVATSSRAALRNGLKAHKRSTAQNQSASLSVVSSPLLDYLPYLFALQAGRDGGQIENETIDVTVKPEVVVQWRTVLTSIGPGRPSNRVKAKGWESEICFTLTTLAFVYNAQARAQLRALYGESTPSAEQRTTIITAATKLLLDAGAIHLYLSARCMETDASSGVLETLSQTQSSLAALALAEATLLAVLKDDPYPAVVVQDRNKNDKDWMIKPPDIPKVRAHLFARLCLAAAEHAGKAEALLNASGRADEKVVKYVSDLWRTSRARACRFFGIDAELSGETGKGIAWLVGAKNQLGFAAKGDESSRLKGIAKLKKDWTERREDKKIEKGGEWGSDAGRLEEFRVIEMLEQKWNKMNDTINTQVVPPSDPLVATLPSGREIYSLKPFIPPQLEAESLARMRATPGSARLEQATVDDDSSEDETEGEAATALPGGIPGSFGRDSTNTAYY